MSKHTQQCRLKPHCCPQLTCFADEMTLSALQKEIGILKRVSFNRNIVQVRCRLLTSLSMKVLHCPLLDCASLLNLLPCATLEFSFACPLQFYGFCLEDPPMLVMEVSSICRVHSVEGAVRKICFPLIRPLTFFLFVVAVHGGRLIGSGLCSSMPPLSLTVPMSTQLEPACFPECDILPLHASTAVLLLCWRQRSVCKGSLNGRMRQASAESKVVHRVTSFRVGICDALCGGMRRTSTYGTGAESMWRWTLPAAFTSCTLQASSIG